MLHSNASFHIVLSRPFDLDAFERNARDDKSPRHTISALRDALDATVHQPEGLKINLVDKFHAKFPGVGTAALWALGRQAKHLFSSEDTVYAVGEDGGFPIAHSFRGKSERPQIAVYMHHPDRPRARFMLNQGKLRNSIDCFITNTSYKRDILTGKLGIPKEKVHLTEEQTDTHFFRPIPPSITSIKRPIISSCGLEQRDYRTLAEATKDMDVDVRICAVSPNAKVNSRTFPDIIPENMQAKHYGWPELRQLYNDSAIVVLTMHDNHYQAGLTALMEAMACRRPVIMTKTNGLATELAEANLITPVPPGDVDAVRGAINFFLGNPSRAKAQAERGYQHVIQNHYAERLVEQLEKLVRGLRR